MQSRPAKKPYGKPRLRAISAEEAEQLELGKQFQQLSPNKPVKSEPRPVPERPGQRDRLRAF